MVQKCVPRNRPPNGPTARHIFAAGNARETRIRAPEVVPVFTANAFADHHRRIRLASLRQPKTMDSLRCSDGMPSTTPHFASNDKALARATFSVLSLTPARPPSQHTAPFQRAPQHLPGLKPTLRRLYSAPPTPAPPIRQPHNFQHSITLTVQNPPPPPHNTPTPTANCQLPTANRQLKTEN